MSKCGNKFRCVCEELEVNDNIDVVFCNGKVISGKICNFNYEDRLLIIRSRCGKCIYINGDYVMYICKDAKVYENPCSCPCSSCSSCSPSSSCC